MSKIFFFNIIIIINYFTSIIRFNKNNPLESKNEIPYFTLVLISNREFHILEKDSKIKDNMGSEFIENNLDCLEIIKNKFIKKTDSFIYHIIIH